MYSSVTKDYPNEAVRSRISNITFCAILSLFYYISSFSHLRKLISILRRNSQVEDKNLALQKIKNLQGQRLVLPINEEQDIYFQQLQASWK